MGLRGSEGPQKERRKLLLSEFQVVCGGGRLI